MNLPETSNILKLRKDIRHSRVGDEGVILRQECAEILVVNDVAVRIVELINNTRSLDDVIQVLQQEYDVDRDTLTNDVLLYAQDLLASGVAETA